MFGVVRMPQNASQRRAQRYHHNTTRAQRTTGQRSRRCAEMVYGREAGEGGGAASYEGRQRRAQQRQPNAGEHAVDSRQARQQTRGAREPYRRTAATNVRQRQQARARRRNVPPQCNTMARFVALCAYRPYATVLSEEPAAEARRTRKECNSDSRNGRAYARKRRWQSGGAANVAGAWTSVVMAAATTTNRYNDVQSNDGCRNGPRCHANVNLSADRWLRVTGRYQQARSACASAARGAFTRSAIPGGTTRGAGAAEDNATPHDMPRAMSSVASRALPTSAYMSKYKRATHMPRRYAAALSLC